MGVLTAIVGVGEFLFEKLDSWVFGNAIMGGDFSLKCHIGDVNLAEIYFVFKVFEGFVGYLLLL